MEKWAAESFVFNEWKGRGINVLKGTGTIVEELEEAQVCARPYVRKLRLFTRASVYMLVFAVSEGPIICFLCHGYMLYSE